MTYILAAIGTALIVYGLPILSAHLHWRKHNKGRNFFDHHYEANKNGRYQKCLKKYVSDKEK